MRPLRTTEAERGFVGSRPAGRDPGGCEYHDLIGRLFHLPDLSCRMAGEATEDGWIWRMLRGWWEAMRFPRIKERRNHE